MTHLDFLQPPFDILTPSERESLKKHTQVRYLAKNDCLSNEEYDYFYVVLKGTLHKLQNNDYVGDYRASDYSNDWFDARPTSDNFDNSYFNNSNFSNTNIEPYAHSDSLTTPKIVYQAVENSLLLQIEASAIDRISAQNHRIRSLLSGDLYERIQALEQTHLPHKFSRNNPSTVSPHQLDATKSNQQRKYPEYIETQQLMLQPVTKIPLLPAHIIEESATLFEAAQAMINANLKHILVTRDSAMDRHPTRAYDTAHGIFTNADLCRAISEGANPTTTPCSEYANFKLRTIYSHQDISEALLSIIRYRVNRLPVLDPDGNIIGILGQSDLLAFLSHHSQLITLEIEQANSIEALTVAVEHIGQYIREQHHTGIRIGIIGRMVQTLNAQVFTKLWQLIVPPEVFENTCIMVMGSEGRGEQILRTDQDNALIIRNGFSHPDLASYAEKFNQTLASMGYPLCDGDIMMNNEMWRQPLNRFQSQISAWFANKEPIHSIWLAAVLDAAYVCGDERLFTSLKAHIQVAHHNADPMFIRSFSRAALQFGDTNQWWKKFAPLIGKPHSQDIDLKKAGIFPLVHGIRTIALENDIIEPTNSKSRLTALTQAGVLSAKRSETLHEALAFFMRQRLAVALNTEDKLARQVDPHTLSALERDLLKECLNVVKSFKNELRQRYQLDMP